MTIRSIISSFNDNIISIKNNYIKFDTKHPNVIRYILPILLIFIIGQLIYQSSPRFYTGDHALLSTIALDFSRGDFYSWYFYGQEYFGNLEPLFLAVFGRVTGFSLASLAAIENLFYLISIGLIAKASKLKYSFLVFAASYILIGNPYTPEFIFKPQGFPFVLLIFSAFYYFFDKFYKNKLSNIQSNVLIFFTGVFTLFSLWHNAFYIIILPILFIIFAIKKYKKEIKIKQVFWLLPGFFVGSIPLILGTIEKNYRNIEWYNSASSGESESILNSLYYYISEMIMYFNGYGRYITISTSLDFLQSFLTTPVYLAGLICSIIFISGLIIGLKSIKTLLVNYLFIGFMLLMLVIRGADYATTPLFSLIRYSIPFHVFWIVTAISALRIYSSNKTGFTKKFVIISTSFAVLFAMIYSTGTLSAIYYDKSDGQFSYVRAYDDITEKYKVSNIYCFNYFEMCGQLMFLGRKNNNLNIQITDSPSDFESQSQTRNPAGFLTADKAVEKDEQVMSVIPEYIADDQDRILETYNFRGAVNYYLIDGIYNAYGK